MIGMSFARAASREIEKEIKSHAGRMRKVGTRTVNKTAAQAKTFASRDMRQTMNLKASRVNQVISVRRSKQGQQISSLRVRRRGVPAVYYQGWRAEKTVRGRRTRTTQRSTSLLKRGGGKGGVTVKFSKDKSPVHFPSGFVAVLPNGHLGLFVRKGQNSLPIKEIMGPNVQAVFTDNMSIYVRHGQAIMMRIYNREIDYEFRR